MNKSNLVKPHWSFWLISIIALLWNAAGSVNYIMQTNSANVANMPEAYQVFINTRPAWATAAFAITVFGGTIGCVLLLFKKYTALYLFVISTVAVAVMMIQVFIFTSANSGYASIIIGSSLSLIVALFLVWFTKYSKGKNWIC